jgi:hypothetical protein
MKLSPRSGWNINRKGNIIYLAIAAREAGETLVEANIWFSIKLAREAGETIIEKATLFI